jgi:RNA polymerase sigma-70 factor (ECF subfamily)
MVIKWWSNRTAGLDGGARKKAPEKKSLRISVRTRRPVRHNENAVAHPNSDPSWDARFRRGDRDVMETVYREHFETVRRAAGRVLREPGDRDAIVHELFTDLVSSRRLRDSHGGGDLGAWLGSIARHRALDFARRERRLTDLSVLGDPAAAVDPLADFRQELARFAARLEPERRRLLELRFLEGMTQVEAAARMSMPRSTLEDWERQLKQRLHAYLLGEDEPREEAPT